MRHAYKLKKPLQLTDSAQPVTELQFRTEVCAGDLRGIPFAELSPDKMESGNVIKLAARLAGQPDPLMAKMSFADLMEVTPLVMGFLTAGLPTGDEG